MTVSLVNVSGHPEYPRMAGYPRFANLRDVADGLPKGSLKHGVLFRSDAPAEGDETPTIQGWPPSVVIDLRDPEELDGAHPYAATAKVHNFSIIQAADVSEVLRRPRDRDPRYIAYLAMTGEKAGPLFVEIVDLVANADGPTLIHCMAGKDRTGIAIGLLLRLCDVDRADVIREYLLTEQARQRLIMRLADGHPEEYGPESARASGAPLTFLEGFEGVLDAWDARPGGAANFYLTYGGTEASLARLRARLQGEGR